METKRLLIAALLSLAVLLAWQALFPPVPPPGTPEAVKAERAVEPAPERPEGAPPAADATAVEAAPEEEASETFEPLAAEREERVVVTGPGYQAVFTNRGAQLLSFELAEHRNASGGPVDLVRARERGPYPFAVVGADGSASPLNEVLFAVERSGTRQGETVGFGYRGPEGRASKRFVFRPDGTFETEIEVVGAGPWGILLGPGIRNPDVEEEESRFALKSAVYYNGEGLEKIDPTKPAGRERIGGAGLRWVGLQDTYFLTALVPEGPLAGVSVEPVLVERVDGAARFTPLPAEAELTKEQEKLARELALALEAAGDRIAGVSYWGPKVYDDLASLPYGLERSVDLGFFSLLARPLLLGLRWLHDQVVTNYGWAIILMTVLIRLLLFPLTHKSFVSMQKMQELNPKMQAIRSKWRSKLKDKQGRPNAEAQRKMNEEIMALYKAEGVNPAGGCLPMLLQIPVLFAFYNLLSAAIELRHAPWIFWIDDLSAPDPYYVLPIVMGASQFLQQKLTPSAADPMQRRIFALMPIFFTVLFLGFPSGLVLYWLTNNILGIGQQWGYKKWKERLPAAAAAEASEAGKPSRAKKASK